MDKYFLKLSMVISAIALLSTTITTVYGQQSSVQIMILGIAQDAGYPQANCNRSCCKLFWEGKHEKRHVSSIGIIDSENNEIYIIDATPDFTAQWQRISTELQTPPTKPSGIFLTHAHIGHYTGLMYLGREAIGAKEAPVYAMPKMQEFLQTNGPWSQLVALKNIKLKSLTHNESVHFDNFKITPFLVPHRDEFSETVGYTIEGSKKKVVFIPDINKWSEWDRDLKAVIADCDLALIDGSFYKNGELPGRDMSEIPHPFVEETVALLANLSPEHKAKVFFTHFNHTNPLLTSQDARWELLQKGFNVALEGMKIDL